MPNWKQKTPRDAKYLKWIGTLSCLICGYPHSVAHHTESGGMGIKGSDLSVVPVCGRCHDMIHRHHAKGSYWNDEELKIITATFQRLYKELGNDKSG